MLSRPNFPPRPVLQAALGFAHSNAGSQDMAAMHLQEALNQARTHKMLNLMPTLYSYKALSEFRNRNYELSKAEAEKGIGKKYADINGAAECYRTLGLIHSTVGEYMLAVENHQMALMIFRKLHHVPNLTRQYIDLGTSYLNMSEIDMAEHFFKKAIICAEGGENLPLVGFAYSRLGTMHLAQGKFVEVTFPPQSRPS